MAFPGRNATCSCTRISVRWAYWLIFPAIDGMRGSASGCRRDTRGEISNVPHRTFDLIGDLRNQFTQGSEFFALRQVALETPDGGVGVRKPLEGADEAGRSTCPV